MTSQLVYIRNRFVVKSRVFACVQLECVSSLAKSHLLTSGGCRQYRKGSGDCCSGRWAKWCGVVQDNKLHSSPHAVFTLYSTFQSCRVHHGVIGACERVACIKRSMQQVFFSLQLILLCCESCDCRKPCKDSHVNHVIHPCSTFS